MKRIFATVAIACLVFAAIPMGTAQEENTKVRPLPLPFTEENNVFYIFGTPSNNDAGERGTCAGEIRAEVRGTQSGGWLYASNNPADPCRSVGDEADPNRFGITGTAITGTHRFIVPVMPSMPDGLPLEEGADIEIAFSLKILPLQGGATGPSFGSIKPLISLTMNGTVIGTWDEGDDVGPSNMVGPGVSEPYSLPRYEVSFPAPATLKGGPLNLTVDLSNQIGADELELRRLASRVVFLFDEDNRGTITLPFNAATAAFMAPEAPPTDDNQTGDQTNGNETFNGNQTGNETFDGNQTGNETANGGNNTTVPDEKGFLPGFEVVAVVSVSLLIAAVVSRQRRPPGPERPVTRSVNG